MTSQPPTSRASDCLGHMVEAVSAALVYTDEMTLEAFRVDIKTQQAVIYNILILGEAATKLVSEFPEVINLHPDIPWKQMRGMRNRMAHGYFEVDLVIVWDTVRHSFPALLSQLKQIVHSVPSSARQSNDVS